MSAPSKTASACATVATEVVANGLCIGCGTCSGLCPASAIKMVWQNGCLIASDSGGCVNCGLCLTACPFADGNPDEDELGKKLFGGSEGHTPETGFFYKCFAGYSPERRGESASGGLASWYLAGLLREGAVDRVISVRPHIGTPLFEYAVHETPEQVLSACGSAYYPVHMAGALKHILEHQGRYAIMGLPCFIKAARLASARVPILRERIVTTAGLACGHGSTANYAEYCARLAGLTGEVTNVRFRKKIKGSQTNRSETEIETASGKAAVRRGAGLAWLSWWFVPNACLFCDDSFAECADVSFMDAWLSEYKKEPGTNIVVARTKDAAESFEKAAGRGEVKISPIDIARVVESQKHGLAIKNGGIELRMKLALKQGIRVPKKRSRPRPKPSLFARMFLRLLYKMARAGNRSWRGSLRPFLLKMSLCAMFCSALKKIAK